MTEDRKAEIRMIVSNLISEHDDRLFEAFDQLHKRDIHDDDVKAALWGLGAVELAEGYVDWMNDGEPVTADEDGPTAQGEELVTDPGDAPSYKDMGTVSSLTEELTKAGINDGNLEQALLDAVNGHREDRIEFGLFYAERSSDGVHWHIYKKRNHNDNGAYLATANTQENAQRILDSLGDGQA